MFFEFDIKMISQIYQANSLLASFFWKKPTDLIKLMTKPFFKDLDTFGLMKITSLLWLGAILLLVACSKEGPELQKLDLQPYGLPITILAPDSAVVQRKEYSFMKDYTVKKGDRFFLQIFEFAAPKLDAAGEKLRQLASVREDPFFKEMIREEDQGFIFSRQSDSTAVEYDFRFIRILGDKELIFQTGLVGSFTLEDVRMMYKAVSSH
jgi:hypothetical protein